MIQFSFIKAVLSQLVSQAAHHIEHILIVITFTQWAKLPTLDSEARASCLYLLELQDQVCQ